MRLLIIYVIGVIFGVGISMSGMANPAKVINFFDIAGTWDPSLMFVMGGALLVTFIGYRLVLSGKQPVFDSKFHLPTRQDIDMPLVGGSALFGVGWGIAGFCPGGAIPAIGTGQNEVFIFMASLIVGIIIARFLQRPRGETANA